MGQTNCSGAVGVVTDFPSYLTGDLADGDDFTPLRTAQPKSPTRTPMIAMTTSSSISVKPVWAIVLGQLFSGCSGNVRLATVGR